MPAPRDSTHRPAQTARRPPGSVPCTSRWPSACARASWRTRWRRAAGSTSRRCAPSTASAARRCAGAQGAGRRGPGDRRCAAAPTSPRCRTRPGRGSSPARAAGERCGAGRRRGATPPRWPSCWPSTTSWSARSTTTGRFFAANERFHMRLLEIADNRWRIQMVADLRKVMKLNRAQSLPGQGRLEASLKEHRQIGGGAQGAQRRARRGADATASRGRARAASVTGAFGRGCDNRGHAEPPSPRAHRRRRPQPRHRRGGELVWRESADQQHFRRVTLAAR